MLIHPGAVGNLSGGNWVRDLATLALQNGRKPKPVRRGRPLDVSGVGHGKSTCKQNCTLTVALKRTDGTYSSGAFETPTVDNSDLSALLGLNSLRQRRCVIDLNTLRLHFCGPGDYSLEQALAPGTETYQGLLAPSGHLALPRGECEGVDASVNGTLDVEPKLALPVNSATPDNSNSASSSSSPPPH